MSYRKPTIHTLTFEELQNRIQVSGYSSNISCRPCIDFFGYIGSGPCNVAMHACNKPEYNPNKCDPYGDPSKAYGIYPSNYNIV